MAQKRTDYSKFTRSNGTVQVLMLWASLALHFLIGSNLGLFGRLDPMKIKPAGGTVRVVDLTPSEQTRVPEAAKSRPLPIAPVPVNPEIATRARSIPIKPKPGTPVLVAPPPIPSPSSVIQKPPSEPVQRPTPFVPIPKNKPTILRRKLDSQQSGSSTSQSGVGSGVGNGNGAGVGTGTGTGIGSGTGTGVGTGTGTGIGIGTGKVNTGESVGNGTGTGVGTGTGTGVGSGTGTGVGSGTGTGVGTGIGTLKKEFDKSVGRLKNAISKSGIDVSRYTKFPSRSYRQNRTCISSEDGYIFIAILLDKNGKSFLDDDFELKSLDANLQVVLQTSPSLRLIASDTLDSAEKAAKREYELLSPNQKKKNQDERIITVHIFDEVYERRTCSN